MEMLYIPNLTIAVLVFDVLLSLALPLGLMLVLRKKFHSSIIPFWVGCVSFFLAVSVLETWPTPWCWAAQQAFPSREISGSTPFTAD